MGTFSLTKEAKRFNAVKTALTCGAVKTSQLHVKE